MIELLLALGGVAVVLSGYLIVSGIRKMISESIEKRIREAENGSFQSGYHAGIRDGINHCSTITGLPIHGFAQCCEHCGTHNAMCQGTRFEYWACRKCKRLNPSPLAPTEELYARKGGDA